MKTRAAGSRQRIENDFICVHLPPVVIFVIFWLFCHSDFQATVSSSGMRTRVAVSFNIRFNTEKQNLFNKPCDIENVLWFGSVAANAYGSTVAWQTLCKSTLKPCK